nr:hypothetical protein Iba_chr01cCG13200 [Ipomoea batatas]GMC54874.1 hypothetical protein Iba_chr01eCG2070 [Ipomoea batatas]GME13378.1 hypothetical protein Iba_scaffold14394CG0010 [Ipomoea batatas]
MVVLPTSLVTPFLEIVNCVVSKLMHSAKVVLEVLCHFPSLLFRPKIKIRKNIRRECL